LGGYNAQRCISISFLEERYSTYSFCLREAISGKVLTFLSDFLSIHDTEPLESTLRERLKDYFNPFITSQIHFALSVTNLGDSKPEYFYKIPVGATLPPGARNRDVQWRQINSLELLLDGLIGSTAIPVLFPPRNQYFDGGVLLNQPITPALFLRVPEPDILYVIIPTARALGEIGSVIEIGQTVMTTWISASLVSQLGRLRLRNRMRKDRTKGEPDERLPVCVIRPTSDLGVTLGVNLLSFGYKVDDLVSHGRRTAYEKLAQFDPDEENETTWYDSH
jgi:predicted acylesterase/phospholipase RssA